jgi:hypothetical protein
MVAGLLCMLRIIIFLVFGLFCALIGFCAGIWCGPQVKMSQTGRFITSQLNNVAWTNSIAQSDKNGPIEVYDYPIIKWRPKALAEPAGAIGQLWTTFESSGGEHPAGKINYKLTLFKASNRQQCQV